MSFARELQWIKRSVGIRACPERAIISVRGDDAREWLQGQVTNQTEDAALGSAVYAFILTLKGRVLADTWVLFGEEDIWLDVPAEQVSAVIERLDRYIIMEDVDLASRRDLAVLVAEGPRANELCEHGWPTSRLGVDGCTRIISQDELEPELARMTARAQELGGGALADEAWDALHVLMGRPRFAVDFGDWTYPQETGLTPIAVSFNKGCYIGQETVVMLQNRGKAPKALWRWTIETDQTPPARAPIRRGGQDVGHITSAVAERGRVRALGFVKRGQEDKLEGLDVLGATAVADGPVSPAAVTPSTEG
jgi:folate-binding protein YgfZ